MTIEKWGKMTHEEHVRYWENYYNRMEMIGTIVGTVIGITLGNLIMR